MSEDKEEIIKQRYEGYISSIPRIEDAYKKMLLNV